jgi:hypothetical protein
VGEVSTVFAHFVLIDGILLVRIDELFGVQGCSLQSGKVAAHNGSSFISWPKLDELRGARQTEVFRPKISPTTNQLLQVAVISVRRGTTHSG